VTITRRYFLCPCGQPGSYAADDVLGLSGRFSRVVQKHACRLASEVSFDATEEHLREMLGVRVSAETLRLLVERHGREMQKHQSNDPATEQAFAQASGEVELAIDAGKVNTREEGWKDLKIAVVSKRELGSSCSPDQFDSHRLPAATMVLAFAMIATSKTFRRCWRPRLKRLGVRAWASVQVLGDGAAWIWKSVQRCLTGCQQTLDVYHACERLAHCAEAIFGKDTPQKQTAYERGRSLLVASGWNGVCRWVWELSQVDELAEQQRRQQATRKLLAYFTPHAGRLNYPKHLAEGRPIGSGVVEGQAKTLGLRLKRRGARWCRSNVRAMASLVCVRHSGQWESYWNR
jgi:hypothetical protein